MLTRIQNDPARCHHNDHHGYATGLACRQNELTMFRCHWTRCILCQPSAIPFIPSLFPRRRTCLSRVCISASQRDRPHLASGVVGITHSHPCHPLHADPHQVVLGREQCCHRVAVLIDHRSSLPGVLEMAHRRSPPAFPCRLQTEHPAWAGDREWI